MYSEIITTHFKEILAALLLMTGSIFVGVTHDNSIKFEDPDHPLDKYMVLYPDSHSYEIVQHVNDHYNNESGTYTEYPDKYVLDGSMGVKLEAVKTSNGVKSGQTGKEWIKV